MKCRILCKEYYLQVSSPPHLHKYKHTPGQVVLRCLLSNPDGFQQFLTSDVGLNRTITDAIMGATISTSQV